MEITPQSDAPDPVLQGLLREPFQIARPAAPAVPFVFASPHSGRRYPADLISETWLSPLALRRSEDAFVDELFHSVVAQGAPLIAASFPRVFVDVNRAPTELDGAMFDGMLQTDVAAHSTRVAAGLGVIPRIVRDGAEIYHRKLSLADAEQRLTQLYWPYHTALAGLVEETRERFGVAVVVDCHSMPSAASMPDIVLGDRYGASASPALIRHAELAFEACGFSVTRNAPYAGGYTTHLYGRREQGIHALQIEVNRTLYLDEEHIEHSAGFDRLRARLTEALRLLIAVRVEALRPPGQRPLAAE
ncbi:MAG: N-formylglutamate amidohydrolase [Alphaproteobacteria bacterium]|nr:N-formylglutamate amidohydrolase [Alphaproteobacteria bacterium]